MSKEAVKAFIKRMAEDEAYANNVVSSKDKDERLAVAKEAGFDFSADEFNKMIKSGEIEVDSTLRYIAEAYEKRGIRLFVRPGIGLFE
jgi:predicted ribosomally synthesized peptide with nif11-like leader